jgi:hypothetical protein
LVSGKRKNRDGKKEGKNRESEQETAAADPAAMIQEVAPPDPFALTIESALMIISAR